MSVPKKRISKRRTRARRSHHALNTPVVSATCPKCANPIRPHYACTSCGYYRGRDVMKMEEKAVANIPTSKKKAAEPKANSDKPAASEAKAEKAAAK